VAWSQGSQLAGHKAEVPKVRSTRTGSEYFWEQTEQSERLPVEPDALFSVGFRNGAQEQVRHFLYEADRGTMVSTDLLKKLRAYYHFIKKQQRHKAAFGIHPVRAVLFETTNEQRGRRLMELVNHPLVCGPDKRAGLFWFTVSAMLTDPVPFQTGRPLPRYLTQPEIIFKRIWALPDFSLHSLADQENSPPL
jgi:hypothetical protein